MEIEDLVDLQKAVGPRRIKTESVEVENHSLRDLVAATASTKRSKFSLGSISMTSVVRECDCGCLCSSESGVPDGRGNAAVPRCSDSDIV